MYSIATVAGLLINPLFATCGAALFVLWHAFKEIGCSVYWFMFFTSLRCSLVYYFPCMQQDHSNMRSLVGYQPNFNKRHQFVRSFVPHRTCNTVTVFAYAKTRASIAGRCAGCSAFAATYSHKERGFTFLIGVLTLLRNALQYQNDQIL